MSYTTYMEASEIDVKIPLKDIEKLVKENYLVTFVSGRVTIALEWEEDRGYLEGNIKDDYIILEKEQGGTFKNSSDNGLSDILERYKGNGIIKTTGEDGEQEIFKYKQGIRIKGKIIFEDNAGQV